MEWTLLYDLVSKLYNQASGVVKDPLVSIVGSGLLGGYLGGRFNHHFTQKREREKLLREKAEALIFVLYQIDQKLTICHLAIGRQAGYTTPTRVERPEAILLDLNQAYALQRLYFPALESRLEAMVDALKLPLGWLETQLDEQDTDFESWSAQFSPGDATPLFEIYGTASEEVIAAVLRAVPESQPFARKLAQLLRRARRIEGA